MIITIMKMNDNKEEYIYVMSNPSYDPPMLKIGWTRDHPSIRAEHLYTSGIPTPFTVEGVITTTQGNKLEKKIHDHLEIFRVNPKREFFEISIDELYEILRNELKLELKSITDLPRPINKKINNAVHQIYSLYESFKKETDEFFGKFAKEKSDLEVKQKSVYIIDVEYSQTDLDMLGFEEDEKRRIKNDLYSQTALYMHGYEEDEERRIKNDFDFIKREIIWYKQVLDNLINNYEQIKNSIGIATVNADNKYLKNRILNTYEKFHNIKNKYEWVF
jgi:hypothetical protein